jgi:hypothetical protein
MGTIQAAAATLQGVAATSSASQAAVASLARLLAKFVHCALWQLAGARLFWYCRCGSERQLQGYMLF